LRAGSIAAQEFAEDERTCVTQAWAANARADWPDALSRWAAIRRRFPANPAGSLGEGLALRGGGRLDEAEAVLSEATHRRPGHAETAIAHAWLANARRDWPEAMRRWEGVCERFPSSPRAHLGAANAFTGAGQADRATAALEAAHSALITARNNGLEPRTALTIEFEIAKARLDWPAIREAARRLIEVEPTPRAAVWLSLAQACWHLGDLDGADAAAARALAVDPGLSDAVLVRAWVATDRGDGEAALALHRRLAELNPNTVRWRLKLIQLLNWLGRIEEAVAELDAARRRWPNDPMVRLFARNFGPAIAPDAGGGAGAGEDDELRRLEAGTPRPGQWKRGVLADDPLRDFIVAEAPGARTAVLVFTGGNDAVSIPLRVFDRYLAALGVTAIYLKDFNRLRFLGGVRSCGDYDATLAFLRAELSRLGVERVCTTGNCDGGFAAIRYGVALGAERILAFAASTHSSDDAPTRLEQARNFMKNRLAASVPQAMTDLRAFLEARPPAGAVELFFDSQNPHDQSHAERLSHVPGVTLRSEPGPCQHGVLVKLALTTDLLGTLANGFGVERD